MENRDNLLGVFRTIYRWRKTIRNVCLLTLAGSIGLSLLLKDYYQATSIFYPASPRLANPELLFGSTGQVTDYYGSDHDLDRMAEMGASKELEDYMVRRFDLYQHYGMDSTTQKGRQKVREVFRGLYNLQKNKNDALELSIEDTDPKLAAEMVNAAREKINAIAQSLTKESQSKLLAAFDTNIKRKMSELERLDDSLRRIQAYYGLYVPGPQGEQLSEQLAKAESEVILSRTKLQTLEKDPHIPRDTIAYIRANLNAYQAQREQLLSKSLDGPNLTVKRFNEGASQIAVLQDLHYQARKQLSYDLERYNQILATFNTNIPALLVVETAEPPLVKSRPKRSIIVVVSVLAAFLFTTLAALIADAYQDLRWTDITQN